MARYENEGRSPRFYEVDTEGSILVTRHGRIGTDGKATYKDLGTPEKAEKEAAKRIADKTKGGYTCVSRTTSDFEEATNPDLEASILEDPDDLAGYLVYADWLQAEGDPRGELITGQAQDAKVGAKLLEKNKDRFCPARITQMSKKPRRKEKAASGYTELGWSHGFIRSARIGRNSDRPPFTVREMVVELLHHPSARLLDELTIGALGPIERYDYEDVIRAIARIAPPSIRTLFVGDFAEEHTELGFAHLGDVGGLGRLQRLQNLRLRGAQPQLGELRLSALRRFALETQELTSADARKLAAADWPNLTEFSIGVKHGPIDADALAAVLAKKLSSLSLRGTEGSADLLAALIRAPALASLSTLDLSGGDLADENLSALLDASDRLGHLKLLNLEGHFLSEEGVAALQQLGPAEVRLAGQRSKPVAGLAVTAAMIEKFAEDAKSVTAARKVAKAGKWSALGREDQVLWGTHPGSSGTYEVFADAAATNAGCTCPSRKYPCKHALGLLLLAADGHVFEAAPPPAGLIDRADAERYNSFWE